MLALYKSETPYRNSQGCKLRFKCPDNKHVIVNVTEFDLQEFSNNRGRCIDYVSINRQKKCGSSIPHFITTQNEVEAQFHSSSKVVANGFKLKLGCKGIIITFNYNNLKQNLRGRK